MTSFGGIGIFPLTFSRSYFAEKEKIDDYERIVLDEHIHISVLWKEKKETAGWGNGVLAPLLPLEIHRGRTFLSLL